MLNAKVLHIITLVFLFLVTCRFPTGFSIISLLRKKYGEDLVKSVIKLEKLDFKHSKAQMDLEFLQTWKKKNVITRFFRF